MKPSTYRAIGLNLIALGWILTIILAIDLLPFSMTPDSSLYFEIPTFFVVIAGLIIELWGIISTLRKIRDTQTQLDCLAAEAYESKSETDVATAFRRIYAEHYEQIWGSKYGIIPFVPGVILIIIAFFLPSLIPPIMTPGSYILSGIILAVWSLLEFRTSPIYRFRRWDMASDTRIMGSIKTRRLRMKL